MARSRAGTGGANLDRKRVRKLRFYHARHPEWTVEELARLVLDRVEKIALWVRVLDEWAQHPTWRAEDFAQQLGISGEEAAKLLELLHLTDIDILLEQMLANGASLRECAEDARMFALVRKHVPEEAARVEGDIRFLHQRKDQLRNPDGTMEFASYQEYLPHMAPEGEPPPARAKKHRYSQPRKNPEMPSVVDWTPLAVRYNVERMRKNVYGEIDNAAYIPEDKKAAARELFDVAFDRLIELLNGGGGPTAAPPEPSAGPQGGVEGGSGAAASDG